MARYSKCGKLAVVAQLNDISVKLQIGHFGHLHEAAVYRVRKNHRNLEYLSVIAVCQTSLSDYWPRLKKSLYQQAMYGEFNEEDRLAMALAYEEFKRMHKEHKNACAKRHTVPV